MDTQSEGSAEAAFVWFLGHILVECGPNRKNKYNDRKSREKISDIFTPKDEAWGLLILLNEYQVWEFDMKNPAEKPAAVNDSDNAHSLYGVPKKKPRGRANKPSGGPRKKFTDGRSGNKDGWSQSGRSAYNQLVKLVVERRNQISSQEWETQYMMNVRAASRRQYDMDEDQDPSTSSSGDDTPGSNMNTPEVILEGDDFFGTTTASHNLVH